MNRSEALKILGLKEGATEADINSAFKKQAYIHHPDRNKGNEVEAEVKFKEVNTAAQVLKNASNMNYDSFAWNNVRVNTTGQMPYDDFIRNFVQENFRQQGNFRRAVEERINLTINLTFAESVLGAVKSVEYSRKVKCNNCTDGVIIDKSKKCQGCGGKGRIENRRGAINFAHNCQSCQGTGFVLEKCNECDASGSIPKNEKRDLEIPPCIKNNQVIYFEGIGNYVGSYMGGMGVNSGIYVTFIVEKDDQMHLEGVNVISNLELTLLEALKGVEKKVKTVKGEMKLKIASGIKNGNQIKVANYGAGSVGAHIFLVNVKYPDDCSKIIELLETSEKKEMN